MYIFLFVGLSPYHRLIYSVNRHSNARISKASPTSDVYCITDGPEVSLSFGHKRRSGGRGALLLLLILHVVAAADDFDANPYTRVDGHHDGDIYIAWPVDGQRDALRYNKYRTFCANAVRIRRQN